ncbi:MAG: hypothetical protein AAGB24_16090 [Bacteroidota bacterium]
MEVKKITYPNLGEHYNKELISKVNHTILTTCGTVYLKKGTRIPESGFSRHPFNEISIITKGCIEMIDGNNKPMGRLEKDTVVYINAGEPQAGNVLEDTELIYVINQVKQ